jgi:hypothetical protein
MRDSASKKRGWLRACGMTTEVPARHGRDHPWGEITSNRASRWPGDSFRVGACRVAGPSFAGARFRPPGSSVAGKATPEALLEPILASLESGAASGNSRDCSGSSGKPSGSSRDRSGSSRAASGSSGAASARGFANCACRRGARETQCSSLTVTTITWGACRRFSKEAGRAHPRHQPAAACHHHEPSASFRCVDSSRRSHAGGSFRSPIPTDRIQFPFRRVASKHPWKEG